MLDPGTLATIATFNLPPRQPTDVLNNPNIAGKGGVPKISWQVTDPTDHQHKPGQLDAGSGTTPTVLPGGYVTIADNANPVDVVVYRTAPHPFRRIRRHGKPRRIKLPREVCEVPVFEKDASATENSLIGAGRSIIVENNYGYQTPVDVTGGKLTTPGVARAR